MPNPTTSTGRTTVDHRAARAGTCIGTPLHEARSHENHTAQIAVSANGVKML